MAETAMLGSLAPLYAELLLAVGAMALLMFGVFAGEKAAPTVTGISVALLGAALLVLIVTEPNGTAFDGAFLLDDFARLMKVLTLAASAVAIAMSVGYARSEGFERFEYPVLIVIATLGMMMMLSANDMIALYLGLELQSLPLYVIAAIHRDSVRSTEAGLKYFVLGALSSGMLLYGISLVYGFTGHTGFPEISAALEDGRSTGLVIGLVFVLAGLAFKISAVPFHMWAPDVYEGAPTPVTAFFAAAPKLAAMGLLIRVVVGAFEPVTPDWQQVLAFVAIASMVLGAFAAIGQTNIKRLMAYSSIGHMGFALVGLAAGSEAGVQGVIVYVIIYVAMTLGAFACILAMRRGGDMVEEISALSGLARTRPTTAFLFAAILFSLAGIPPLAGFFAKYYVFLAAIEKGLYLLAVIGVVASVIGAYYYVRIVKIMYFDEPDATLERMPLELKAVLVVTGVFILAFPFIAAPVVEVAGAAAASLFLDAGQTVGLVN